MCCVCNGVSAMVQTNANGVQKSDVLAHGVAVLRANPLFWGCDLVFFQNGNHVVQNCNKLPIVFVVELWFKLGNLQPRVRVFARKSVCLVV